MILKGKLKPVVNPLLTRMCGLMKKKMLASENVYIYRKNYNLRKHTRVFIIGQNQSITTH